jgi:hypothetical protein
MVFVAGLLVGAIITELVPKAQAAAVDWNAAAQDPAFRAAVIEVINECIVDNGIIFCN